MITEFDDYLCHQTLDPMQIPSTSDHRYYARYFLTCFDDRGEYCIVMGMGNYANNGVQDSFALLSVGDAEQRNLRASRRTASDLHVLSAGPIEIEVLRPLHEFRMICRDNDLGFSFDVRCTTVAPPWERRRRWSPRVNGRVSDIGCHFNQGYRCEGWLRVDGRTIPITADRWAGVRDRSWGVGRFWEPGSTASYSSLRSGHHGASFAGAIDRGPYGVGPNPVGGPFGHHNSWVPFDDPDTAYLAVSFRPHVHTMGGALIGPWGADAPPRMILGVERSGVRIDSLSEFQGCDVVYEDESGARHEMSVERLTKVLEGPAGYADMGTGFEMGKPPEDAVLVEGETMSREELKSHLAERRNLGASSTFVGFHVCRYEWGPRVGYGSFEADQYEMATMGNVRYDPPRVISTPASAGGAA